MPTWYEVLGVPPTASTEQIRKAWREVARTCHPDKTSDPEKNDRFRLANEAKSILLDPDLRAVYDTDQRRVTLPPPPPCCPKCGLRLPPNGRCPLCIIQTIRPKPTPKPKPKPRRRRRIHLDLDPILLEPWTTSASSVDDLLLGAMHRATVRTADRSRRGPRVEIPVGPDLTVVIDQSTIRTIRGIVKNADTIGQIARAIRGWFR